MIKRIERFLEVAAIIAGLLCALHVQAQPPQHVNQNYQFKAAGADSAQRIPKVKTANPNYLDTGAIEYNVPDSGYYEWTGSQWLRVTGAALTRIFGKNHISIAGSDTAVFDTLQYRKIYNVVSFGADSTGVSDATTGIQAAINAAAANGGGVVYSPRGNYKIAGALNPICNCQIYIPAIVGAYRSSLVIEGESCSQNPSSYDPANPGNIPTGGTIWHSTITGSGLLPGVIGTAPNNAFNNQDVSFRFLQLQVFSNNGTIVPSMSGYVLQNSNQNSFYNCIVSQDVLNTKTLNTSSSEIAGIIVGSINNTGPNILSRVSVSSFKYDIVSVEHTIFDGVYCYTGLYAFVFPRGDFASRGNALAHACKYTTYFPQSVVMGQQPGGAWVNMDIETEVDTGSASLDTTWYAFRADVIDTGNNAHGGLKLTKKVAGSAADLSNNITKVGGLFFDVVSYNSTVPGNAVIQAVDTTDIQINQNARWDRGNLRWIHLNGGTAEVQDIGGGAIFFRSLPTAVAGGTTAIGNQIEQLTLTPSGNAMGTASPNASCLLDMQSTTKGLGPPQMTTTQKLAISSPRSGLMVYDTTLNQMSYFNGTSWINF